MTPALPSTSLTTFGDLLKHLRRRARLTQKELSIAVGYSEAQISRLEQNQRLPDLATLAALFVPALGLEDEAELVSDLLALAARARGERVSISRTITQQVTEEILEEAGPALPAHLPAWPLTSFVGREREVTLVWQQLAGSRLVTLTGPGGCGKTRLALAALFSAEPRKAVGWVDLGALSDPATVPQAMAAALDVKEAPGRNLFENLVESLRHKDFLLVLDNCEHVVAACAHLVAALLRACPQLRVLATSREPLNLPGETVWPVPPLTEAESVQLFLERAQLAAPGFSLPADGLAVIGRIGRQLDGIPLAVELAAARVRTLSLEQVAARLDDALGFLKSHQRGLPSRHQTLEATLDWSYGLLDPAEKALFQRLAVFVGGFTLEAAEQVAGDEESAAATLDTLTTLVDKSLVNVEYSPLGVRYRLLEVVRQYAQAWLARSGEAQRLSERHAHFYLALAEALEPKFFGAERRHWVEWLEQDHANLRAALEWGYAANDARFTLRLGGALIWFWHFRGHFAEGRLQLERSLHTFALSHPADESDRARVAWGAGLLAWTQGDYALARSRYEASLQLFRREAPSENLAHALSNLGLVALSEGRLEEAQALTSEAVTLARAGGWDWGLALLLYNLGAVAEAQGDESAAHSLMEESRARFKQLQDAWGQSVPLVHLGLMAARRGDGPRAQQLLQEALILQEAESDLWGRVAALALLGQIHQRQGQVSAARDCFVECMTLIHDRVGDKATLAVAWHGLGDIAWAQGEWPRAAQCFAAAQVLQNAAGGRTPLSLTRREDLEQSLTLARAALGAAEFEAAERLGQVLAMSPGSVD